ncbi:MAG: MBL fold metallo-hydrolase [Phycisphaerales bacterium]|nr:MBL fold metallo-hydrolase [Phycisphaerales bacterium]
MTPDFYIRFWGVRGSTPAPGPDTVRYGGETTCFEIGAGDRLLMIDCGSGARKAGNSLAERGPRDLDLYFTHTHLDHICGMPFFCPAYDGTFRIRCHASHFLDDTLLSEVIGNLMAPPVFPLAIDKLRALNFLNFKIGATFDDPGGLKIETLPLNHPGGCCGYKFTFNGKTICLITDHEHGNPAIDAAIEKFVQGTDIMVYDGMFTDDEYWSYAGWGHSTWQAGVRLANKASVKVPVITHHDPSRTDDMLDEIADLAEAMHPGSVMAHEGMVLAP